MRVLASGAMKSVIDGMKYIYRSMANVWIQSVVSIIIQGKRMIELKRNQVAMKLSTRESPASTFVH